MTAEFAAGRETPVVLAHGAWADGSSWSRVISHLQAWDVKAYAAPLPLTSLREDVAALNRVLDRTEKPTLLVGHAYAGAVIGSAQADRVSGLVYVAALAPDEGETVAEVFNRAKPHPQAPELTPDSDGLLWLPDKAFPAAFAQNASEEDQAILASVQRPISVECITTAVGRPLWKGKPSWYFVAEEDRMISPETQHFMADRMHATVRSMPTDHAPLISAPGLVSELILEVLLGPGQGR